MCNFFSFITDENGKPYYFDWNFRKVLLKTNPKNYKADSHTSIASYFKINEDKTNKYEYNPLTKVFQVDQINIRDDSKVAKEWVQQLDFKTICEQLIVKPIINPFQDRNGVLTDEVIDLFNNFIDNWKSIRKSVGESVWNSIRESIGESIGESVWNSVWESVRESVWKSVWESIRESVRESVGVYISSFFDINYKHNLLSLIMLWELGFVISFDGKTYRLHTGIDAKIVHEKGESCQ